MNRRRKRRIPFAAYAALIFNGALIATPFMAAHLIAQAYGDQRPAFLSTPEALEATRVAMDERFQHISRADEAEPRQVWSGLVREALAEENVDMARVRGLLLGAPAMLDGKDGEALRARVAVSDGTGDEAMVQAALAYLPVDVQSAYENIKPQSILGQYNAAAPPSAVPGATTAVATSATALGKVVIEDVADESAASDEPRMTINRLGSISGHAKAAVVWVNDDKADASVDFLLSGIGLILANTEESEGASVAMSTLRTRTASPIPFKAYLTRRIEDVVPVAEMRKLLAAELGDQVMYTPQTGPVIEAVVERVFKTVIDREKLAPLLAEFKILRQIAEDTSVESAIQIISRVKDGVDLRAAGLVAAAGGDRAVALEHFDGDNLLGTARTAVPFTTALKLQVAGVLACLLLLAFVALTTFWKSFRRGRPVKKSAVYLMEEHPA